MKHLLCAALISPAIAFAAPSVTQVESAIQDHRYVEAEAMLEQVVKEHPDSAKAHYYLGQVYNINGQLETGKQEIAKYYAMKSQREVVTGPIPNVTPTPVAAPSDSGFTWFFPIVFIMIIIFVIALINFKEIGKLFIKLKQNLHNHFNADQIAKETAKVNSELLAKCMSAKKTCRSNMTMLKVNGLQESELYDAFAELYQSCIDAIECLTKGGEFNTNGIKQMLADVDTSCYKLDTEMKF